MSDLLLEAFNLLKFRWKITEMKRKGRHAWCHVQGGNRFLLLHELFLFSRQSLRSTYVNPPSIIYQDCIWSTHPVRGIIVEARQDGAKQTFTWRRKLEFVSVFWVQFSCIIIKETHFCVELKKKNEQTNKHDIFLWLKSCELESRETWAKVL